MQSGVGDIDTINNLSNERNKKMNKNNDRKKCKIVFKQELAGYLMMHKFVLVDMRPDNRGTGRNVFFFNNTPELQQAIQEYLA